jgi:hypothetical protein
MTIILKMTIQYSKSQSNAQNDNPIFKMTIQYSKSQSNIQNGNPIFKITIQYPILKMAILYSK